MSAILSEILKMSVAERLELIEAIRNSIAISEFPEELTTAQFDELKRCWINDKANPDDVVPWETLRTEARARSGR